MNLYQAVVLDFSVVTTCAILLARYARMSALHPAFVYLVFHLMVFTYRIYGILSGSPTLFTNWQGALPVSDAEIAWAANLADIALVTMTVAWIKASADDRRQWSIQSSSTNRNLNTALLSKRVISVVAAITAPIGIVALLYFGNTPALEAYRIDLGAWNSSSWTVVTQSWAGLALLALIYYYGFRAILVAPMCAYLLVMALQGANRFRVVLPLIYLLSVWLSRKGRQWPPLWMVGTVLVVSLLFFPMKIIGIMAQTGQSITDIAEVSWNVMSDATSGHAGDQVVMDEFASTVSAVDDSDHYYYGTLYYPLLTMPLPRQLWPDKPLLNWYQYELSSPSRPMARAGMVATLHGESYANLGIMGIIIISYVSAYGLGRFYFAAMRRGYFSVYRFTYVMVSCSFVQVFRDGLMALVLFTLVDMTPLVAISLLSYYTYRRTQTWNPMLPSNVPGRQSGGAQA